MSADRGLRIETSTLRPGADLIEVTGEVNLAVIEPFKETLKGAGEREVLIDLSSCEFIDSTAIALILFRRSQMKEDGRRLVICSPSPEVERVLRVAGLMQDGFVYGSVPEALAASPL